MPALPKSPEVRRRETLEAFTKKVEILETWALSGLPEGETYPRKHNALRSWPGPRYPHISDGGRPSPLGTWSDPTIDRPTVGKYPTLARRFAEAVAALDKKNRPGTHADLEHKLKIADAKITSQTVQLAELLSELFTARADRDYWKDLAKARTKSK